MSESRDPTRKNDLLPGLPELSDYPPEQVAAMGTWVQFISDVLAVDLHLNPGHLKTGIDRLAQAAQRIYPELESDEAVTLELADIQPWPLPDEIGDQFVRFTGDILFMGQDGPLPTAAIAKAVVDQITGVLLANRARGEAEDA